MTGDFFDLGDQLADPDAEAESIQRCVVAAGQYDADLMSIVRHPRGKTWEITFILLGSVWEFRDPQGQLLADREPWPPHLWVPVHADGGSNWMIRQINVATGLRWGTDNRVCFYGSRVRLVLGLHIYRKRTFNEVLRVLPVAGEDEEQVVLP